MLIDKVLQFATEAHEGQTRWNKKIPFIVHPIAVSKLAVDFAKKDYKAFQVEIDYLIIEILGLNHDIPEDVEKYKNKEELVVKKIKSLDTENELDDIDYNFLLSGLKVLNKNNYNSYLNFVLAAKLHPHAFYVKKADITHNLSDLTKGSMKDKYELALYILGH
jgi:(p)ppGpp synthase/HD superfamily hydrolase